MEEASPTLLSAQSEAKDKHLARPSSRTWEGLFFNLCKSAITVAVLVLSPPKVENLPVNIWSGEFSCD